MVVKSLWNGHRVSGLYVGVNNVRRYFPKNVAAIDLHLDHLRIRCELKPHFWEGRPEIQDPRLCNWLELKQLQGKGRRSMAMIPSGEDAFILGPANAVDLPFAIGQSGGPTREGRGNVDGHGKAPKQKMRSRDAVSNLG
jgi:hypothetical protein